MTLSDWTFLALWMSLPSLILAFLAYCGWRGWRVPIRAFSCGLAAGIALQVWQGPPEGGNALAVHNSLLMVGATLLMASIAAHALGARKRRDRGMAGV